MGNGEGGEGSEVSGGGRREGRREEEGAGR